MKIADMLPPVPGRQWDLARQIGVRYAVTRLHPDLTGGAPPPSVFETLLRAKTQFASAGLELIGLEGEQFPMERIKRGLPGRDEDIETYKAVIRNMGALGLEFFSYSFMAFFKAYRTSVTTPLEGGSITSSFDYDLVRDAPPVEGAPASHQAMWDNYEYFLTRIIPVAEEAGVRMALHPDDPPIPEIRGVPRIFGTADAFRKAMALVPSEANAINFCQGNFVLFDEDLEDLIREFGAAGKIAFVHFRDVRGDRNNYVETLHHDGPTDMARALKLYDEVGFKGALRIDHVPAMAGESEGEGRGLGTRTSAGYETLGRLYAIGYVRGLLEAAGVPED